MLLRKFIKSFLKEEANRDFTDLALYVSDEGNSMIFVLYDAGEFIRRTKEARRLSFSQDMIKGTMKVQKDSADGNCYDAWQVTMVAAVGGYGPTMYDIALAMVDSHTLMPDRASVTGAAANVWNYFKNKRGDVQALKLDTVPKNKKDDGSQPLDLDSMDAGDAQAQHLIQRMDSDKKERPKQDSTKDDCFSAHYKNKDILDFAYRLVGAPINVTKPIANHAKIMSALQKKGAAEMFAQALASGSSSLFSNLS